MKPGPLLCLLLITASWLDISQNEERIAEHCTGVERAKLLRLAHEDAARFRSYTAMWWRATQAIAA